jgi:hypothetical protein
MVVASLTVVIGQGTAAAAEGGGAVAMAKADCRASPARLCLWDGTGYSGARYEYGGGWSGCVDVASTWNDRIGSAYNRLSRGVFVYQDTNCSGTINYIRPGQAFNLSSNNEVTSIYFE